jgi:hypothetical protein
VQTEAEKVAKKLFSSYFEQLPFGDVAFNRNDSTGRQKIFKRAFEFGALEFPLPPISIFNREDPNS